MNSLRRASLLLATLTTGLIAGFFYAYTCSVTLGLNRLDDAEYIAAMQSINATVRNWAFAVSFFGSLLCLGVSAAVHLPQWSTLRARLILAAFLTYALGGFVLTMGISVPLNEELARVSLTGTPEALAQAREAYEGPWNFWNMVRTAFSMLAFLMMVVATFVGVGRQAEAGQPRRREGVALSMGASPF